MKKWIFSVAMLLCLSFFVLVLPVHSQGETLTLQWKPGAYYDTLDDTKTYYVNSRRYCVVPCSVGDEFSFQIPSEDWRVYAYFADSAGTVKNFEALNGSVYRVRSVNGRTPTELRITVAPSPNDGLLITDDVWNRFDVTVSKKTVTIPSGTDMFEAHPWNGGSYYDSLNTGHSNIRRYTSFACQQGEQYKFMLPSSLWRMYVYLADSKGTIINFEVHDGAVYTVSECNGRIPSEMRITVAPNPDSTISTKMWNGFNAGCFRTSVTVNEDNVKAGTPNDLFVDVKWTSNADGSKTCRIPCELRDTFAFDFGDTSFSLKVSYETSQGAVAGAAPITFSKDGTLVVGKQNDTVPSYLAVTAVSSKGDSIDRLGITCVRSSDHITFGTMNYGLWCDGTNKYVENSKLESVTAAWKKMFDDHDLDILCGQEWLYYFDKNNTLPAETYLFADHFSYQYSTGAGHGKNIVSKTPLIDPYVQDFSTKVGRQFVKTYTNINGKNVCIINVHCSLETDFNVHRKAEFEEMLALMKQEEYVILCGDFNAYSLDELKIFTDAGYVLVNGGAFGAFNTNPNFDKPSSWKNKSIDHIVVSPNIEIVSVQSDRRDLSDHNLLVAELWIDGKPEGAAGESDSSDQSSGNGASDGDTSSGNSTTGSDVEATDVTDPDSSPDGGAMDISDGKGSVGTDVVAADDIETDSSDFYGTSEGDLAFSENEEGSLLWLWVILGVLAAGGTALVAVLLRKKGPDPKEFSEM